MLAKHLLIEFECCSVLHFLTYSCVQKSSEAPLGYLGVGGTHSLYKVSEQLSNCPILRASLEVPVTFVDSASQAAKLARAASVVASMRNFTV